jgi:hypothetical protein
MKKFYFWSTVLIISIIFSICCTYIYGYFMHNRYWVVTIPAVHEKEINLLKNILSANFNSILEENNIKELKKIFEPIDGKIYIEIINNNRVLFENRVKGYEINYFRDDIRLNTNYGPLIFRIATYKPPTWSYQFWHWMNLKNIIKWFSTKYDFITYPFISFLFISFLGLASTAFWYKARHESKLLREILEEAEL